MVWAKFIICILVIFFSGRKVAKYGDIIADRTGLGGVWIGVILISAITSLPELFTGISAVTIVKEPDLAVGDILGANAFNLFNLALLDIISKNGSLLSAVSPTHRLTGWFSIILMLVVGISIFVSFQFTPMSIGWIGWYTPIIILLYALMLRLLFVTERQQYPNEEAVIYHEGTKSNKQVYLYFTISSAFIIGAGIWLAAIGNDIALATGWERSFVGSLFLAFSTTLPEITVSFTAMRMGARDLAVANLIGSNLFNLTIIAVIDLLYIDRPILAAITQGHLVTAATVVIMTLILIMGLSFKPRRIYRLNWWNCALIILFLAGVYFSFAMA